MPVTTKTFSMAGKTTYRASVSKWNDDQIDHVHLWSQEFRDLESALDSAKFQMKKYDAEYGQVIEGTYRADTFHDDVHGLVRTANWIEDNHQWDIFTGGPGFLVDESKW
jgi:hypothetical protein